MTSSPEVYVITGANRGLGLEFVKQACSIETSEIFAVRTDFLTSHEIGNTIV